MRHIDRIKWVLAVTISLATGTAWAEGEVEFAYRLPTQAEEARVTPVVAISAASTQPGGSTAYPQGDFYRQLSAATGDAPDSCEWDWGCNGSPYRTGPGRCDNYKVGPRWGGKIDGLVMFRDGVDLAALGAAAGAGGVTIDPTAAGTLSTDIDHGGGIRALLVGHFPQCQGYEMQIGYTGVFAWDAAAFNPEVPPAAAIALGGTTAQKSFTYQSSLHSLELNARPLNNEAIDIYGGVRYVLLADDLDDTLDVSGPVPILPTDPVLNITDVMRSVSVDNNLIGFQGGVRTNLLSLGKRFYFEGFANSGVYCNLVRQRSRFAQTTTFVAVDDPATAGVDEGVSSVTTTDSGFKSNRGRIAYVGEAALSGVYQVNCCLSARAGYQVLYLSGIETGQDAFLGLASRSDDLLMHGFFAGLEYRR